MSAGNLGGGGLNIFFGAETSTKPFPKDPTILKILRS